MLRSIRKAYEMIKEQDPETSITLHTLRVWCKENKITNIHAGTKVLIDIESLNNFINGKTTKEK
jgi:hypothetical protein